ncbi:hypothetical protein DL96DRAFT_809638 [Flagelloscypha sp. PMI_526]|nr:hypothetical protein DL96DRAFT_809638 [Flagelloscypha sp. PMI_526]
MTNSNSMKATTTKRTRAARVRGPYPSASGSGAPTFTCHCGKTVRRKDKLRHEESHLDDSQRVWVTCPFDDCTYRVSPWQLNNMYAHARSKHTFELLECSECRWSTTQNSSYSRHYKDHHPGATAPRCPRPTMPESWIVEHGVASAGSGDKRAPTSSTSSSSSSTEACPALTEQFSSVQDFESLLALPWTPSPSPPSSDGDSFQIPPGFESSPFLTSSSFPADASAETNSFFSSHIDLPSFDFTCFFMPSAWSPLQEPISPFLSSGSGDVAFFQAPDSQEINFWNFNSCQKTTEYSSPLGCEFPSMPGWLGPLGDPFVPQQNSF